MFMKKLFGTVCAIVAPMTHSGEIDEKSLRSLCDYLAECGVNGIYPNGTNGEGILLSQNERQEVARIAVEQNKGRMSAFIHCMAVTTSETCSHVKHASLIGADGAGIMTPLFFPCDDLTTEQFYDDAIACAPKSFPIYVYNLPSRTGNEISPALLRKIMDKHENVLGVKFSVPDLMRVQDYFLATKPGTEVLVGCDSLFLQSLVTGCVGTISGPAMVFGKRFSKLYRCYVDKNYEEAACIQRKILETDRELLGIPAIPAIKTMLMMQGVIKTDMCRKPLRALSKDEKETLSCILKKYEKEAY